MISQDNHTASTENPLALESNGTEADNLPTSKNPLCVGAAQPDERFVAHLGALTRSPLFARMTEADITAVLTCFDAQEKCYGKGSLLIHANQRADRIGVVAQGSVTVFQEDFWGNRNLVAQLGEGQIFAESYACIPGDGPFGSRTLVSVRANERCQVLWLSPERIMSPCLNACENHRILLQNLLGVLARKNVHLNEKAIHMGKRSTREKLLSYLSAEASRAGSPDFTIPFNRQQLADYLTVDRSAMCVELSKLQAEGVLSYHRNEFHLNR